MIQFKKNRELQRAFQNLRDSMEMMQGYLSELLPYMEGPLSIRDEQKVLSLRAKYHLPNRSLVIPKEDLLAQPYYKNIHLKDISFGDISYEERIIQERTLMNTDFSKPHGKYLFHDHPLGYFKESMSMPALFEGDTLWMSPAISEFRSMEEVIKKGQGKCVTFGLGIGFILYMWLLKKEVTEVTVVEENEKVIALFQQEILPQFPKDKPIHVLQGNALDYFHDDFLKNYDYAFVDFWASTKDGLPALTKLLQKQVTSPHVDYWIEEAILMDLKYLVALYLHHLYEEKPLEDFMMNQDLEMMPYAIKVNLFFKHFSMTLTTERDLLHLLHSKKILRAILSI